MLQANDQTNIFLLTLSFFFLLFFFSRSCKARGPLCHVSESRHKDCKPRKAQRIRLNEGKISFLLWKCHLCTQEWSPVLSQRNNSVQNDHSEYLLLEKLAFFCEMKKEEFSRMLMLPLSMQSKCMIIHHKSQCKSCAIYLKSSEVIQKNVVKKL